MTINAEQVIALLDAEIEEADPKDPNVSQFVSARVPPKLLSVNFSGGIVQKCWTVTRTNGDYRVVYLPTAGYFSLCVESQIGLLDIGVHGSAIGCFSSV